MTILQLFPQRVQFVDDKGRLTPEAYRALQTLFDRVGGPIGDNGEDSFSDAQGFGVIDPFAVFLANETTVQPSNESALMCPEVIQKNSPQYFDEQITQPSRELDLAQGWATYIDTTYTSGSPFAISSGVETVIPNDAGAGESLFTPSGVGSFYDSGTSKITPARFGDLYLITVQMTMESASSTDSIEISFDIGGTSGKVYDDTRNLLKGAGVATRFTFNFQVNVNNDFMTNGGQIKLTPQSHNLDVYDISYRVTRIYSQGI